MAMLIKKQNNDNTLSKGRVNTIGVVPITQVTHVRKKKVTFKGGHLML